MIRCLAAVFSLATFATVAAPVPAQPFDNRAQHTTVALSPPAGALQARQVLNRGNGSEPESLDPALVQSMESSFIVDDLFEGLTGLDVDGQVVPGIAQSWSQSDPLTWVFNLRASTWSNGDPLTAADFVASWQRYFDPAIAAPTASSFDMFVANAHEILGKSMPLSALGVRALDPLRLEVKTPFPVPFLPEVVAHHTFVPVHSATIKQYGRQWTRPGNLVSNGAFVLSDWRVNDRITLKRNPAYWNAAAVRLSEVNYLAIEDHAAEYKLYQAGELDLTRGVPPGSFQRLKAERPAELKSMPSLELRYYSLNNTDPVMKDKRVRQALSMVIDRDILVQRIMADGQIPAYSVLIVGISGADVVPYEWSTWPLEKRVATARALLAQAGLPAGTRLTVSYNTNDYHKKIALFLASEWKAKLGLLTTLQNMEFRVLLRERNMGHYQIARDGWVADYRDATSMLTIVRCGSTQNSNRNCNQDAETLLLRAQSAPDKAARSELQTRAAALIMQDYPMIPLSQGTNPHLVQTYVGGHSDKNPLSRYRSQYLYLLEH